MVREATAHLAQELGARLMFMTAPYALVDNRPLYDVKIFGTMTGVRATPFLEVPSPECREWHCPGLGIVLEPLDDTKGQRSAFWELHDVSSLWDKVTFPLNGNVVLAGHVPVPMVDHE